MSSREPVPRGRDGDSGFATVWVVTAMAVVGVVTAVSAGEGVAIVERHRAANAADAAALAAAGQAIDGPTAACAAARSLARSNGATVTSCRVLGAFSEITVTIRLPGPLAGLGSAAGQARAGPVSAASGEKP